MEHWATVLDCIECGIEGNKEHCRRYAELLLEKLEVGGEPEQTIAKHLRRHLSGDKGQPIQLAEDRLNGVTYQMQGEQTVGVRIERGNC